MKVIMSPHAGCYNHGCEAIIRSTAAMLNMPKERLFLYSSDPDNDRLFGLDRICTLIPDDSAQKKISESRGRLIAMKHRLLGKDRDMEELSYLHRSVLFDRKNSVFFSVGGDNYCYTGMQHVLSALTKLFSYQGIPGVLWGCSFEESLLSDAVIQQLRYYSVIAVRESLSYEILQNKGITENVVLCSDPAFTLELQRVDRYDPLFADDDCIGINISALMRKYNAYPDAIYRNVKLLIEHILKTTDSNVMFVAHVCSGNNNDLIPAKKLADEIGNDRITIVDEELNCMQLKYLISKCRQFIGCRTHACIAAYSTGVPTLAVAYSTKAGGIAKDIFNDTQNLLADVRRFQNDTDLVRMYEAFCEREEETRAYLKTAMPSYIQRAYEAKKAVESLI